MRMTSRIVPGLLAGAMLAGGVSGVFAAKGHTAARPAIAAGQVTALNADGSFTLTFTPKKAGATPKVFQVTTTTATKEVAARGTTGALAANEYAVVVGSTSGTGAIAARRVLFSTSIKVERRARVLRAHLRRQVAGTVNLTQSSATQLTLTTKAGKSLTFAITPATKFRVAGQVVTSAPTFTNGERVRVVFTVAGKGTAAVRTAAGIIVPKAKTA